jgi:hypothetical protein
VLLARGLGRRRHHQAADQLLGELQLRLPAEASLAIQRARLLEWSLHRPAAAHAVVLEALARLRPDDSHRSELERRLARLERRLSGRAKHRRERPAQTELFPDQV